MSEQLPEIKLPTPLEAAQTLAAVLLQLDANSVETVLRAGMDPHCSPNQAQIYHWAGMIVRGETLPLEVVIAPPAGFTEAVGV